MIVVEGFDGGGKSTLCQQLKDAGIVDFILPSPWIPAKGNVSRMKYETSRYLRLYGDKHNYVVDRFLFSEMAYGKVLRGSSAFSRMEYLSYLLDMKLFNMPLIFCFPTTHRFKPDEDLKVIENQKKLLAEYRDMYNHIHENSPLAIEYNWESYKAFDNLKNFLQSLKAGTQNECE